MTDLGSGVPSDFDLDEARRARSSTPLEQRKRCPHCGSENVGWKSNAHGGEHLREHDGECWCDNCGEHFDEPVSPEEYHAQ